MNEWRVGCIDSDWYVLDDTDDPQPVAVCPRGEQTARQIAALRALVLRAATESTTTMYDDPGCFFCDHLKHTKNCPAKRALGVK
jgi:hypothetical protein